MQIDLYTRTCGIVLSAWMSVFVDFALTLEMHQ